MRIEHGAIVHAIERVAGKDHHVLRVVRLDVVEVLRHGIGSARVPRATFLRGIRGQDGYAGAQLVEVPGSTGTEVGMKLIGTILGEHADGVDAGVRAVGQREVDDAILPPE